AAKASATSFDAGRFFGNDDLYRGSNQQLPSPFPDTRACSSTMRLRSSAAMAVLSSQSKIPKILRALPALSAASSSPKSRDLPSAQRHPATPHSYCQRQSAWTWQEAIVIAPPQQKFLLRCNTAVDGATGICYSVAPRHAAGSTNTEHK